MFLFTLVLNQRKRTTYLWNEIDLSPELYMLVQLKAAHDLTIVYSR